MEVDEEDSRGGDAAMRTPGHNEGGPSDMDAVNDQECKVHNCTRAFLDIEEQRWSGDEGVPHQCLGTDYQGGPPEVGMVDDKAAEAVGWAPGHSGVRDEPAKEEDARELSERDGGVRAFLATTQQLQGGNEDVSLKGSEPVDLDAMGSEGEAA